MKKTEQALAALLQTLTEDRREAFLLARQTIKDSLPNGFEEVVEGPSVSYVVPLRAFPSGYHCTPGKPLPFLQLAFQKNFLALYHFGLYADEGLLQWWKEEYSKRVSTRLDMGKSCIRFKKWQDLPLGLIADLCRKMTVEQWVAIYTGALGRKR